MSLRDLERDAALVGRRWLRELLFEEWSLKLLALLITAGLWLGVTSQRTPAAVRLRRVQLFLVLPSDVELSNDLREELDVSLRGSQRTLAALKAGDVVLNYDASNLQPGTHLVRLTPQSVTLEVPEGINSGGIEIERIEPASIRLQLERRVEREFVVSVPVAGQPAKGFELLGVTPTPNRIRVRGPESHINALQKVQTEPVSVDERADSFTVQQVVVDIADPKLVPLTTAVDVQVQVGEMRVEKTLTGVAVHATGDGGQPQPAQAVVTLRGPRSALEHLNPDNVTLLLEHMPDGQLKPRLQLPPGSAAARVELVATDPAGFSIKK
jgi:YbbR domain-containing protein